MLPGIAVFVVNRGAQSIQHRKIIKPAPHRLADFIGLDVCLDIMRVLVEGLGDPKYRPCPLLVRMVSAGWLGRKSGRGFYTY